MSRRSRFSFHQPMLRALAAGFGALRVVAPAAAQGVVANPQYDAMFRQVLREPANLDLSFRFAEAAVRAGDHEAAIGALERMLFYKPQPSSGEARARHPLFPPRLLRDGAQLFPGR